MSAFYILLRILFFSTLLLKCNFHFNSEVACKHFDVRQPSVLSKLLHCTVIEGDLFIVFTTLPKNARLPKLREITGTLLIYDLEGPDDLSQLLPNLTLVRGQTLVYNYAIIIKGTSLKNIGLPSLRLVQQGGVRVDSNPHLCYVNTVNWDLVLGNPNGDSISPVRLLKNGLICSDSCPSDCVLDITTTTSKISDSSFTKLDYYSSSLQAYCWSSSQCQSICPKNCTKQGVACTMDAPFKCCHPECLAGCYGDGPEMCVACKNVMYVNRCISHCPDGTFRYLNRRCVTETECLTDLPHLAYSAAPYMSNYNISDDGLITDFDNKIVNHYAILNDTCLYKCPTKYKKSKETGRCLPCGNECEPKHCREFLIYSLKDVKALIGCYSAKAIYLSIQEGKPELVTSLLETAFANLRIIQHSLRIVRSSVITTLHFLKNVKFIGQPEQNNSNHLMALEIVGNDNLQELWSIPNNSVHDNSYVLNRGLQIHSDGIVRISQNRQLCPDKIFCLFESGALQLPKKRALTQSERDLISITNGDLAYCNWDKFKLKISNLGPYSVHVSWIYTHFHPILTNQYVNNSQYNKQTFQSNFNQPDELVLTYLFYQLAPTDLPNIKGHKVYDKDSWRMFSVSCNAEMNLSINSSEQGQRCELILNRLEPASRYAVYAEMKFPLRQSGAISNLVYFTTLSINPSPPRFLWLKSIYEEELQLTWLPPINPSGMIDTYLIWIRILLPKLSNSFEEDFCFEKPSWMRSNWENNMIVSNLPRKLAHTNSNKDRGHLCDVCLSCPHLNEIESLYNYNLNRTKSSTWPSSVSGWMVDDDGIDMPIEVLEENNLTKSINSHMISLIVKHTNLSTVADNLQIDIKKMCKRANNELVQNLGKFSQFAEVLVEVQACLEPTLTSQNNESEINCSNPPPWKNLKSGQIIRPELVRDHWSSCESKFCSVRTTVIGRVKLSDSADHIPLNSIQTESIGPGSVRITWSNPIDLNGFVLHHMFRYRLIDKRKSTDNSNYINLIKSTNISNVHKSSKSNIQSTPWLTKCISMRNWIQIRSENPQSLNTSTYYFGEAGVSSISENSRIKRDTKLKSVQSGGLVLNDLSAGIYQFQIMVVSLAGNGKWSPVKLFTIPSYPDRNTDTFRARKLLNICLISGGVFLLFCLVLILTIYKARRYYFKATAWTSINPDYCTIYEVDAWEMCRDDIDVLDWKISLGRGSFGTVYKGIVRNLKTPARMLYKNPTNIPVAIKTLNNKSTLFDRRDFINEACFMKQFQSYHLVRLLGLITKTSKKRQSSNIFQRIRHFGSLIRSKPNLFRKNKTSHKSKKTSLLNPNEQNQNISIEYTNSSQAYIRRCSSSNVVDSSILLSSTQPLGLDYVAPNSPLVIMELMNEGDLATYLRHLGDIGQGSVTPSQAYLWATQIADGMAYLAAKKYVHRDLAARNCLVDARLIVKIGDFGLCRDIYEHNYYRNQGRGKLPIRWMAPESLQSVYFTSQSDVWSYGVVLWEIATMACLPYRGMSHEEVMIYVLDGNNLLTNGIPTNCPELFPALMLHCWNYNPHKRPTFLGLAALLSPRFGDAEFRLASFFYMGEQRLDPTSNTSILEAPATFLNNLIESSDQDPAHDLATALNIFLNDPDDEYGYHQNDSDNEQEVNHSVSSQISQANERSSNIIGPSRQQIDKLFDKHTDIPHRIDFLSKPCLQKRFLSANVTTVSNNSVALTEVRQLLRLRDSEQTPIPSVPMEYKSCLILSDVVPKFSHKLDGIFSYENINMKKLTSNTLQPDDCSSSDDISLLNIPAMSISNNSQ